MLAAIGGFEIAAMAGACFGAAAARVPVVVDGFIATAAAAAAERFVPAFANICFSAIGRPRAAMRLRCKRWACARCSTLICGSAKAAGPQSR